MKDLNELFLFLKDKTDQELISIIEKNSKELVKLFGMDADLHYKGQIRTLDNFKNWLEYYFNNQFKNLLKQQVSTPSKLLTVKEVANELNITEVTVYTYIKNKTLTPLSIGSKGKRNIYRFNRSEIDKLKEKC